jgi:hypothetical protein
VRTRLGRRIGFLTLAASNLLNLITCAAEIGGLAILLHLLTGRYHLCDRSHSRRIDALVFEDHSLALRTAMNGVRMRTNGMPKAPNRLEFVELALYEFRTS